MRKLPFLDFEKAFDSISHIIIEQHGLDDTMCKWICSMLGNRKLTATLKGETLEASMARGYLQWGILSPLLCSLIVDELRGAQ